MTLPDLLLADTRAHADYFRNEFLSEGEMVRVLPVGYERLCLRPRQVPSGT